MSKRKNKPSIAAGRFFEDVPFLIVLLLSIAVCIFTGVWIFSE
jgi:hypothetical protein